ncbi:hypothetical protein KA478_02390 [Patescibacteria group bacterium]|nr:hypothetical protein [Patescibacteria group bacterium]
MYTTLYECAYTNASQTDAGPFQYNVRYNELLYYKLLITRLADDMYKNPNIEDTTLQENIVKNLDREKQNLKRELVISQNALQIMDRSITSIRSTLPLHI